MQSPQPLFYFLVLGTIYAFGALALKNQALVARLGLEKKDRSQAGYFGNLEGLRGFLAFSVFLHHSVNIYFYNTQGAWVNPSSFYVFFGHGPVTLFFFLTGFLFWNKLLNSGGKVDAKSFFVSRFKRLAPSYYFSILLLLIVIAARTDFTLHVRLLDLATQLLRWASFGLPFGYFPDVNGLAESHLTNAGVAWSLRYEWCFYFLVPAMGIFARKNQWVRVLGIAWVISFVLRFCHPQSAWIGEITGGIHQFSVFFVNAFAFGIAAAALRKQFELGRFFIGAKGLIFPALGTLLIVLTDPAPYGIELSFYLFLIFLPIVYGQDFFGVLNSRVAQFFGAISYNVYLVHGLVLFCMYRVGFKFFEFRTFSQVQIWSVVAAFGVFVTLLSTGMHLYLELPFIRAKKAAAAKPSPSVMPANQALT